MKESAGVEPTRPLDVGDDVFGCRDGRLRFPVHHPRVIALREASHTVSTEFR